MLFNHIEISNFTEPNVQEKAFLKQNSLHTHTHTHLQRHREASRRLICKDLNN